MNIGLSQRILHYNNVAYDCLEHGWYNLLSGHTLFCIPNNPNQDFAALVAPLDLIVFTGGDASPHRLLCETRTLTECYRQHKSVLGVCHGAFFINELEQGENGHIENHYNTKHDIVLEGKRHQVNSFHNNQIIDVGEDLQPIARAEDGGIEAFKHVSRPVWGLVWHPERMKDPVLPSDLRRFLNDRHD